MGFVIHTPEARAAITELPITALLTDKKLQMRNVGMQKVRDDDDAKRYRFHIKDLARSIEREGQRTPIRVVADNGDGLTYELAPGADTSHPVATEFWVVDGHHRLEAMRELGLESVKVTVLEGLGFDDALVESKLSNRDIVQGISRLERTENAWSALNIKRDRYRAMPVKEAAGQLCISTATLKRMRQAIRDEAIEVGAIDESLPRPEQERQFMKFWGRKSILHRYSLITWAMHSKGRRAMTEPSVSAKVFLLKVAITQSAFGDEGRFSSDEIRRALTELGEEAQKHGVSHLNEKYKPHVTHSYGDDDEEAVNMVFSEATTDF